MRPTFLAASALSLVLALPMLCSATSYSITDLGTLGGIDPATLAYAMNNSGQVAGYDQGTRDGFLWSSQTGIQTAIESAIPYAMNDAGQLTPQADRGQTPQPSRIRLRSPGPDDASRCQDAT